MYQRVQGAVGFFDIHLTTILPANLPVNKFLIGSDLTEFGHESGPTVLAYPVDTRLIYGLVRPRNYVLDGVRIAHGHLVTGGSVAEWLACWT